MMMATLHPLLLGFLALLWWCFSCVTGCKVLEPSLGTVSEDQELLVGSTLKFQCTLYNKTVEEHNITSSNIILKLKNTTLLNTRIVDRYTVEYLVENASVADTGMYGCFAPHKNYDSPQLVCLSFIAVGFKPLEVHNFSCISLGYTMLNCSWATPFNPVPTSYKLHDFLYNSERLQRTCPVPSKSSCFYNLSTNPVYVQTQTYLNFIVAGENSLGKSKQYFRIKHAEIIKPSIPNATTEEVSRTSLALHLGAPTGLQNGEFSGGLLYSVKYYSISSKLNVIQEAFVEAEGNARLMVNSLVPNTQYRFEVRCRLNFLGDRFYWSDVYNATDITQPDVPYMAPVIDKSSFDVQVIAGNRTITLYWKAVPSEFENGNDFHYIIRYHEHYVPTRATRQASKRSSFSVRVDNKTSHSFAHMDIGTAYMFNIVAGNRMGNSTNETGVIVVDKAEKFLPGPKDITVISYGQGSYDISWKHLDPSLTNFTLFWCETLKSRPAKCEGPLGWTAIVGRTTHQLFLPSNFTNYQFGVAAVHGRKTSGMVWAPCTALYGVTYKIPKVELVPKNSTSLRLRWPLKCEAEKKIIKEYAVYYCPFVGKCSYENARHCTVNGSSVMNWPHQSVTNTSQTEHILGPLRPFTCYFSYIRVRTDAGWGENSDFASEETMSSAPSGPPTNVYAISVIEESKAAAIQVSFNSPKTPNGVITRYKIFYNKTLSEGAEFHKEVRVQAVHNEVMLENVFYYSNYSIEVAACVERACSEKSEPVYVYTGISRPGIISLPHVEISSKSLNVTWDTPRFPNGPVDLYQVWILNNDTNTDEVMNITGKSFFVKNRPDCKIEERNFIYSFKVRAVNLKNGVPLYGDFSDAASTEICKGSSAEINVGILVGLVIGSIFVLVFLFYFARYFLRNINEAKKTKIKLPKGLESPLDVNPLSSYDKFKSGLQNSRDSGIPNDRVYDRLFSSASEGDLKRAEELTKRTQTARNPSGESDASTKNPDSISSANTTKTHNSLDSGAEVESPPSPDSFSSNDSTTNTTPRIFKPGLRRVSERYGGSRDSGLVRDDSRPINVNSFAMSAKGIRFGTEHGKSDPEFGDGSEPLMNPGIQPYMKYGESRSDGSMEPGYSKYGLDSRLDSIVPQHPQVFSALTTTAFVRKKDPPTEAYSKFGEVKNAYMSVNDVMNSAKASHKQELPGQLSEPERVNGYVPVEISYPDIADVQPELEVEECVSDLADVLPANFKIKSNEELDGANEQSNGLEDLSDGTVLNGPGTSIVPNSLFHGGGTMFMGNSQPPAEQSKPFMDNWCELDTIRVDPDSYTEGDLAQSPNGGESDKSTDNEAEKCAENSEVVLTEQPVSNGFGPLAPMNDDLDLSPTYVLAKPNMANVPVESV